MTNFINKYLDYFWDVITLEFVFKFLVVYFFIIWVALIVWVIKDISIRTNNLYFQVFCVLLIFVLTPLWVFIYLLIRPWKTLYERYYDEIDLNLDIISEIVEERKKLIEIDKKQKEVKKPQATKKPLRNVKISKKEVEKSPEKKKTQIKVKKF